MKYRLSGHILDIIILFEYNLFHLYKDIVANWYHIKGIMHSHITPKSLIPITKEFYWAPGHAHVHHWSAINYHNHRHLYYKLIQFCGIQKHKKKFKKKNTFALKHWKYCGADPTVTEENDNDDLEFGHQFWHFGSHFLFRLVFFSLILSLLPGFNEFFRG